MGQPLTWRNVEAPDFRSSILGVNTFANLFGNAAEGLSKGLGAFDASQKANATNAIMMEAMKYNDPAAYAAAMANGSLTAGVDKGDVTAAALQLVDNRANTLLDRKTAGLNQEGKVIANNTQQFELDKGQYGQGRVVDANARLDAATPMINEALAAAAGNNRNRANALLSDPSLQGLRPDQLQGVISNVGANNTTALGGAKGAYDFTRALRDDGHRDMAQGVVAFAAGLGGDPSYTRGEVEKRIAGMPPEVQNAVRASVAQSVPGSFGPNAAVAGIPDSISDLTGGRTGTAATAIAGAVGSPAGSASASGFISAIPLAETKNYVQKITDRAGDVTGSIDEKHAKLVPFVVGQESNGRRYGPDGQILKGPMTSSGDRAEGEMQVMPKTQKDPGYGVTPAKDNSPDEIARVGRDYLKAMLTKYDGDVPKALAAYNAGPGAVDSWNKTPAGAIANATTPLATKASSLAIEQRNSVNIAEPVMANIGALRADKSIDTDIADKLVAKGGWFENVPRDRILGELRTIRDRTGENAAVAGEILRNSAANEKGIEKWIVPGAKAWYRSSPLYNPIDSERLEANLKPFATGDANNRAIRNFQDGTVQQSQAVVQQMLTAATAARVRGEQLALTQPGAAGNLPRLREDENKARALLAQANAAAAARAVAPIEQSQVPPTPAPVATSVGGGTGNKVTVQDSPATLSSLEQKARNVGLIGLSPEERAAYIRMKNQR